jgi:hypothetical protein
MAAIKSFWIACEDSQAFQMFCQNTVIPSNHLHKLLVIALVVRIFPFVMPLKLSACPGKLLHLTDTSPPPYCHAL